MFFGIRDPGWEKPGSGINIPDPQHCIFPLFLFVFSYFFPQMTSADISPPPGGGGIFQYIGTCSGVNFIRELLPSFLPLPAENYNLPTLAIFDILPMKNIIR